MVKDFVDFIDESYLDSNHVPLYHFTYTWSLVGIFKSNVLSLGHYDHNSKRILSLTRDKNFDIPHREFEVKLCLDKDKLFYNYRTNPYDFFSDKPDKKKWEIGRKNPFESEEFVDCDIRYLDKYILYVDFFDVSYTYTYLSEIKTYINRHNIECRVKEKVIDINGI